MGIIICAYNIPFNFYVGLHFTAYVFTGITLLLLFLYYLSRFRGMYRYTVTIVSVLSIGLFIWNYFYSDGVRGASLLSYTLLLFLLMIVASKKHYFLWFLLVMAAVWGNMLYELYHPDAVRQTYDGLRSIIIDQGSTVTICLIVIFIGLYYLKEAYYREKQKATEKTEALEELDREKNKLFSILSHDLRSPLHSISAYLEMIQSEQLPDDERGIVERMLSTTVHNTQEMLSNILVWSKDQLHKRRPEICRESIAAVIQPTIILLEPEALRKNIRVFKSIDPAVMAMVNAAMLQVIVRNLIGNAIKFTDPGGSIYITAAGDATHMILTVKDSGKGIEAHIRDRIFSLNIGSTYGTMNEKGVGLGLYLCKEYTLAQNGEIWFETEEKRGTTFFVQLPVRQTIPEGTTDAF
ncbi:sensor histidine kinase [Niabella aurantiaca]|uniref:sensor histidine kinase n=1 Tax=Niabella aurantiaca TaxID=379900 RepID=UPI00146C514D|nr:HAMP domain-containing sensor histidine kinase [Niabella aurantiaca]